MRGILIAGIFVASGAAALGAAGWLADDPAATARRSPAAAVPADVATAAPPAAPVAPAAPAAPAANALPPGPTAPILRVEQQTLPAPVPAPAVAPIPLAPDPMPQVAAATVPPAPTPPAPTPPAPTAAAPNPAPQVAAVTATPVAPNPAPPAPAATAVPGPQAALPPAAATTPPTFDIVRINPQGRAVIAGRSTPNAEITVLVSGEVVAVTRADAFGEWVAIPDNPLPPGPRELTVLAQAPNGERIRSEQIVTVIIPGNGAPTDERAVAVLQDRAGIAVPRLLQGAVQDPAALPGALTLDAVQYDEAGNIVLAGRARQGLDVQAFIDNRRVGVVAADPAGLWQMTPAETIEVGRHELRLEQVDPAGVLIAQVAVPIVRAAPEAIRTLAPGEVIVQPGNSLWRLARNVYGRGTLYTVLYLANANQIQNPDLIYPGQIFMIPAPTRP